MSESREVPCFGVVVHTFFLFMMGYLGKPVIDATDSVFVTLSSILLSLCVSFSCRNFMSIGILASSS